MSERAADHRGERARAPAPIFVWSSGPGLHGAAGKGTPAGAPDGDFTPAPRPAGPRNPHTPACPVIADGLWPAGAARQRARAAACLWAAAVVRALTACGKTHAAFDRRSIPAEPLRFAPFCVAFRSKYTRYSSLTRLVSRAPHRPRRSRGFHHRLLRPGAGLFQTSFSPAVAKRRKSATFAVARRAPSWIAAAAMRQSESKRRRRPESFERRAAIPACSKVRSRWPSTTCRASSVSAGSIGPHQNSAQAMVLTTTGSSGCGLQKSSIRRSLV